MEMPVHSSAADRKKMEWAESGIGPRGHRFFRRLMQFGGPARGYHMAAIVSFWYVLTSPTIRKQCRPYLDRRFPGQSRLQRFLRTIRLIRNFSYTLVDEMVLSLFGRQAIEQSCPEHDQLVALSNQAGGLIILQTHLGSWQSGIMTLSQFGKAVAIVLIEQVSAMPQDRFGDAQTIDARDGLACAMQMSESLLAGKALALMGDRTLGNERSVLPVKFLGGDATFPIAPYRLASATGAPILVMTAPRLSHRKCELRLARIIRVPPGLGRNPSAFAPYLQEYVQCLENFVRDYPWQFFNFYDMWKKSES